MKQIILIRHAKVNIDNTQAIYAKDLQDWVQEYDTAAIDMQSFPTLEVQEKVKSANIVVTSTLSRAIDSAEVLEVHIDEKNAIFNEAGIPVYAIPILKLKPKKWLVILRVLLLLGLGKKDTSFKASKHQAKEAAGKLLELSVFHDSVVLVGHGGMNWLIKNLLLSRGWVLDGKASHANFGMTILKGKV